MSPEAPSLRLRRLGLIASLILVLLSTCGRVGGISFTFNGFTGVSDLYSVPGSNWAYSPDDSSIYLATGITGFDPIAGRLLYPALVRMRDPNTNFSTTFIFQIYLDPYSSGRGPGMAFIMVPDNSTLGAAIGDYMGLLTVNTSQTAKNSESDDHSFGVEIDTHMNPEFKDPNDNHIGIDSASTNSTHTYIPTFLLTTDHADMFLQMWIDYFQADSRMDIYIVQYGQDKPATPLIASDSNNFVDLSLLNQDMYVGFAAAVGLESTNQHTILAWSFNTDGPAPPIRIARDAPPPPSPPPPAPPPPRRPPPPTPTAPSVPAAPAPNSPPPPLPSPPPPLPSNSPPPPDSPAPESPPPPVESSPPNTGSNNSRVMSVGAIVGIVTGVITTISTIGVFCWKLHRRLNR